MRSTELVGLRKILEDRRAREASNPNPIVRDRYLLQLCCEMEMKRVFGVWRADVLRLVSTEQGNLWEWSSGRFASGLGF